MKEFIEFKKIPRLSRECVVTEKIDGTNGVICITEEGEFLVGSRSRWIDEHTDNHGFYKWASENKYDLPKGDKRFSLFNVVRWCLWNEEPKLISIDPQTKKEKWQEKLPVCCGLVPILWTGIFDTAFIEGTLTMLKATGSKASPGFMRPEGIVIFHKAGNLMFKKTIEKDEEPKGKSK